MHSALSRALFSAIQELFMVTKDMLISEVIEVKPDCARIFQAFGMHCLGCAIASGETLEQAAAVHGFDVEDILAELNK